MTTPIPAHRHGYIEGTAAVWTTANPVLGLGEPGWESDTALMKVGDGSTAWNDLPYANRGPAGTDGTDGTDGAPGSSDLTFTDNGDGTGTISWNAGATSTTFPLLTAGLIPVGVLPAVAVTTVTAVADEAAMLALDAQQGDVAVRADNSTVYMLGTAGDPTVLADWIAISQPGAVASVAGKTGIVTLVANDISDATTVGKAVMAATNSANARSALGLGGASVLDVGTVAGTVAAGDDSRFAPAPTVGNAGKVVTVKADGTGYELDAGGGALTFLSGALGGNVLIGSTSATILTISGLTAGTWLINVCVTIGGNGGSVAPVAIRAFPGTGSPTLSGPTATEAEIIYSTGSSPYAGAIKEVGQSLCFLATCTTTSTVTIYGISTSSGQANALAATLSNGNLSPATGWTAVKIA